MSTLTFNKHIVRSIDQEISRLNIDIDCKILCGLGYSDEARRHRILSDAKRRILMRKRAEKQSHVTHFFMKAVRAMSLL